MDSILNIEVSCFANYDTPDNPKLVNLLAWLKSEKYRGQVEKIRSLTDKAERDRVKATLPAITPSGVFTYRSVKDLVKHTGFIQFDIDANGNESVGNFKELKAQLSKIKNVAYCGLSVSGTGFWGLIPIAYPEKHNQHHKSIEEAFRAFGITIDPAPKSVASLRGYSFDADAYFNHKALIFEHYYVPPAQWSTIFSPPTSANTEKIFETAGRMIEAAPDGQKWHQLSKASYLLGGYVGAGYIDKHYAIDMINKMIDCNGYLSQKASIYKVTAKTMINKGINEPTYLSK